MTDHDYAIETLPNGRRVCFECDVDEATGRRGRETDPTLGVRILATDFYFYEVRCVWAPVPPHWVGAWTRRVPDRIRDRLGVELY